MTQQTGNPKSSMSDSGILRLVNIAARQQGALCSRVLTLHGEELLSGAIVTAEAGRLRIRPADTE